MTAEKKPRAKTTGKPVKDKKKRPQRARPAAEAMTLAVEVAAENPKETIRRRVVIAGAVTDTVTRLAIANAVVKVVEKNFEAATRADGSFYFTDRVIFVDGQPQFLDLPAGQYTLTIMAPHLGSRYGEASVANVVVQNDANGRPVLDSKAKIGLSPTRLVGQVKREDTNQPLAKAAVQLRGSEIRTLTGTDGKYVLSGLVKGKPTVQVSAEGFVTAFQEVTLNPGQETIANFSLNKT
jgi:hypothetical protein